MILLFKRLVAFFLCFTLSALLIAKVVDNNLRKSSYDEFAVWNDIYSSKCKADLLVTGSSTATFHVSTNILDSALHLNSYNIGMTGLRFDMQYERFKVYLQHNSTPKYIIQIVALNNFEKRDSIFKYTQFLPYLNDSIITKSCKGFKNSFSLLDEYLPLYKYRNDWNLVQLALSKYGVPSTLTNKREDYKGYRTYANTWNNNYYNALVEEAKKKQGITTILDKTLLAKFEDFLSLCRSKNIKVIMVYTPDLKEAQHYYNNREYIINAYNEIAKKYTIPFIDYSNDTMTLSRKYFYDARHLTQNGSVVFTKKLSQDISTIINQNNKQ